MFLSTVQPSMNFGDISQHCGFSSSFFFPFFLVFNREKLLLRGNKEGDSESMRSAQSCASTAKRRRWPVDKMQDKWMYGWMGCFWIQVRPRWRQTTESDCGSFLQLIYDLIFAFCGWRHFFSPITWFGNSRLCRATWNIIQLSLTTECEQRSA